MAKKTDADGPVAGSAPPADPARELLLEAYTLLYTVSHRSAAGPGVKAQINGWVRFRLEPFLGRATLDAADAAFLGANR